jgi:hypothetical protein
MPPNDAARSSFHPIRNAVVAKNARATGGPGILPEARSG